MTDTTFDHVPRAPDLSAGPRIGHAPRPVYFWSLVLAVLLPAFVLGLEVVTGFCAGVFFDPVATGWHLLLVASVPAISLFVWAALCRGALGRPGALATGAGFGIAVAAYYAALYAPLMPASAVAVLWFGMGFLSLTPFLCLAALVSMAWRLRELRGWSRGRSRWVAAGFGGGVVAIAALDGPAYVARVAMNMAASEHAPASDRGIALLRAAGSESTVLRACYEPRRANAGGKDNAGWVAGFFGRTDAGEARELYYRMTGRAFNSVPPPRMHSRLGQEPFGIPARGVWDDDQGGAEVGGRVPGLSLVSSRLDTHIDSASALAYTEWALVFSNRSPDLAEARFDVALPPAGAVSRLTLWIDGEPHEAAFGTRSQTRRAYQSVVQRQRDPVLVTQSAPGRVLVQCYPVPVGGEMKIRFGVTAPLDPKGRAWLPSMLDRNFAVGQRLRHSLWAQCADREISTGLPGLGGAPPKGGGHGLGGQVTGGELGGGGAWFAIGEVDRTRPVHALDRLGDPGSPQLLVRRGETVTRPLPERVVVVLDTSAGMRPFWEEARAAIGRLADHAEVCLVLAADEIETAEGAAAVGRALDRWRPAGGIDNSRALLRGLELAARDGTAPVLWLHGAQPVLLDGRGQIEQALDRRLSRAAVASLQLGPGADVVSEFFAAHAELRPAPRGESLEERMALLFAGEQVAYRFERLPAGSPAPQGSVEVWDQLVRHSALEEVAAALTATGARGGRGALAATAARYQLVTPLTGAVVLENSAQFDAAGLDQLSATETPAIPTIPEPSAGALAVLGALLFATRRRRRST